jgi:hypothetical protein
MFRPHSFSFLILFLLPGCVQQIAVSTVADIVHDGFSGFMEEEDLAFAGEALPANLKLLEVMLKSDPENKRILELLSEGYCSYALGFVEDDNPERAKSFYVRGFQYASRILGQDEHLIPVLEGNGDEVGSALKDASKEHVAPLFWAGFGLGSFINLSLTDPDALAELPRAEAMMAFVAENDSGFYHGGADLFLGTLYGSRPKILGGDIDRAKKHFERAIRINKGKFLMTQVYFARSVAVQTLDEPLFDELLETVERTPLDVLPAFRLPNAIAKEKARRLRERKPEFF